MIEENSILEIIIPTFRRPKRAIEAIESCVKEKNCDLVVSCNSNGADTLLSSHHFVDERVKLSWFDENRGALANIEHLLCQARGKFILIMSDEDKIIGGSLGRYIDYLSNLDPDVNVVLPSIFDASTNLTYHRNGLFKCNVVIDGSIALTLDLLHTYLSGYTFRRESLVKLNIKEHFRSVAANVYPHVDIARSMLVDSALAIYIESIIDRGLDEQSGGDAYSHRVISEDAPRMSEQKLDLNPLIYGAEARIRQFYYELGRSNSDLGKLSRSTRLFIHLGQIADFGIALNLANRITVEDVHFDKRLVLDECLTSFLSSNCGKFASTFANIFRLINLSPIRIALIINRVITRMLNTYSSIYCAIRY